MIGRNKNYKYGHHMYDRTGINNIKMPVLVLDML